MSDQRKANAANSSNSSISNNNKLEDPGVYMNCRLMHSFTSLIGATVEVELMGGERYEGIFKTFSPKCDLVLCSVAQIINDDESEKRSSALGSNVGNLVACLEKNIKIEDQVVFDQASLIKFRANNIDLDFATMPKKTVLTDGEISGVDGKKMQEKELVPWDDGGECDYNALEESSNGIQNGGWDSSEMFDYNERNYNINSTYNDDMSGYTIKLEQREDPDFVQRKIHAEKIAREIEKDPKRQSRLAKENDLDEETRFSAVVADRKGQRNGPNNALPINNSNNNNSNNNSMTRGSPRNEMSHSGRDGRDGQRRESMRSNRGDPGRDSRERDFSRQNSRQGGSGGGGPSGGGGRGRDMDRRIDNRGVGGGGGGDMRNDGRNDGRIDGRNDGRNDGRIDGRSDGGRNDGRGGDRGGDGRGDRGRGNDRRISGGINEANWRTDNRRSVNDRRKMDEPQLQPQQQQQQPKKADQRPSQTPPPPQTPGTPSSSISDAGTTKSDSSAFSKKDTSPKAGVTAAAVVALSVAPQPNNSPSLVPQTTLTASDSPVSGAYSKKESSPMAGAAAPVALGGGGGGTNVPSSPAGAAPPSGAPPSAVTTPVSASSSSSSLPTPSSASSSQSTGSGEIKSNLNPNAKAFTPRANPSPAAMQQQYMLAASQQHQQQQQQQAQQQQQQQQQAMVNFSYQSQHMVTSPPSTMPNQYIQISPHPSHLPPQSIHHHLPPHQQQGHPHQQPGHPHQQPGHPHQQQPHPHQHQAHPHQPQGQPHQQQGPHPQMGPGGPYMQFPPYNLPIPQMLPNGAQYITIPNVPTMPNAMPHGGLYTGPVPGVPTQAGPGQPTGPNPAGGPGGYPCNVFFHHNVSLPGPMPGIGGPKQ